VTELINNLVETAASENDNATRSMLNWFVDEQVEEEDNASSIVEKIKLVENAPGGIFMIDQELSKRVFNPPADMEL
jgi:ferritin